LTAGSNPGTLRVFAVNRIYLVLPGLP
jgi:hypothetical protein